MGTTCDYQDKCIIKKIKKGEHIIFGDCIISKKVGQELCSNCDSELKILIKRESEKNGNNKKV